MTRALAVSMTVNGRAVSATLAPRLTLADFLRDQLGLTGTHLGCEHGVCGACTVMVDGQSVRGCLMLAVQADGCRIVTVEGLASGGRLSPLQECFRRHHALQCGFCTPGMLITAQTLLDENPRPSLDEIRSAISGNLCRCTGYLPIVAAIAEAASTTAAPARDSG